MAVKDIIARGIGFNPGSVAFIVTHGLTAGGVEPAPVARGGYVETPAERRRRLAREKLAADRNERRFREMSLTAIEQELRDAMAPPPEPEPVPIRDARAAVREAVEPFRQPEGELDVQTMLIEQARLTAILGRLARLQVELENREDEDAIALLLLMSH